MERKVAVEMSVPVRITAFTVEAASGGAGDAVVDTTPSRSVVVRNAGGRSFEYKVDSGEWSRLGAYQTASLDVNLASAVIYVRKSGEVGAADPVGQLEIEEDGGALSAGGEPTAIPGSGSRHQTGTDDVAITEEDVVVSFTNTTGPAAKRNVVLPEDAPNGRQVVLIPDGGDQAFTIDGNGKTVVSAVATGGAALAELATARAWTLMWSEALDKWIAW